MVEGNFGKVEAACEGIARTLVGQEIMKEDEASRFANQLLATSRQLHRIAMLRAEDPVVARPDTEAMLGIFTQPPLLPLPKQ